MKKISIHSQDSILQSLNFRPYRNTIERTVKAFTPGPSEEQTMELVTPWGDILTAQAGDLIVGEVDNPKDRWPVRADIFDETYVITRPGYCIKLGCVHLVPLVDLTDGDEDAQVTVHSLEGPTLVRAGDFLLARGVAGEIWAYPKDKALKGLALVDDSE